MDEKKGNHKQDAQTEDACQNPNEPRAFSRADQGHQTHGDKAKGDWKAKANNTPPKAPYGTTD